jgi:uncharacterized alkaline shock family protein YloU
MVDSTTNTTGSTDTKWAESDTKTGTGKTGADRAEGTGAAMNRRGVAQRSGPTPARSKLVTDTGSTSIADGVVAKIAGLAAREIPGVQSMGTGMSRRMNQLKSLVPGTNQAPGQGVSVEVGEREAAVDLDIVTWYGQSIVEISEAVRSNVIERVEEMTGLKVVEVNINVDDVYVEGDEDDEESRVQ